MKKMSLLQVVFNHIIFSYFVVISNTYKVSHPVNIIYGSPHGFHFNRTTTIVCQQEDSEMQTHLHSYMDASIDPCVNFYQYVCGKYDLKKISPEKELSSNFDILFDKITQRLRFLIERPFRNKRWNDVQSLVNVQNLYKPCTNRGRLLNLGIEPVSEKIKILGGWPLLEDKWDESQFNWINFTYALRNLGFKWNHFLNVYVDIDRTNSKNRIVWIDEGSNYFSSVTLLGGLNSRTIRSYIEYQVDISMYFGASRLKAKEDFEEAMRFAIKIAEIQMQPEERHDITKQNNKYTIKQLTETAPFVPWVTYINTLFEGWAVLTENDEVNVSQVKYLEKLATILNKMPKRVVANYLMWFVLKESLPYLAGYIREKINALNEDINGLKVDVELWKECLDTVTKA